MREEELEEQALEWFAQAGWLVSRGADIAPDGPHPMRSDYGQVLLLPEVKEGLIRLNTHLPEAALDQALARLQKQESRDFLANNRGFHRLLLEGIPVEYREDGETHYDRAFLIDFDPDSGLKTNVFRVVNQFTIQGIRQLRRPDIICFVNGLPLVVMELKSPGSENADIWDAFHQLQTYKEEIPDLFSFNEALVISDGFMARVGSLTANQERFLPWKALKSEKDRPVLEWQLEAVVRGFLDRELFLDYLRYFIFFESDSDFLIKKIAGYHQFHAVRQAVEATVAASSDAVMDFYEDHVSVPGNLGSKKAGVVWHTQGSGKSISMCCYAGKLIQHPAMKNPTLLIVTDRNDLDGQLFETFSHAQELLKQEPRQALDRESLRELLSERESGGILFTTVQKFALLQGETSHPVLNERHNIVVISDEAHRSQYGLKATLKSDGTYQYGFARHMRDALPNASFIGFTGTPIASDDKDTRAVFGDYVSIYDIQDAVEDGATVPIYYESRLARLDINQEEIEELSEQMEEMMEDDEDLSSREKAKGKWSRLEKLIGARPRMQQIAEDLITHFEARTQNLKGKAMIVGMSREICVHLYDEIVALRPHWHHEDPDQGAIKIILSGSASDKAFLQPHIHTRQVKKCLEQRFKDENDSLRLVIVRDMWLTGFDAPCCHTMYVDKPMKGHNLMQAIARVNRVFKDKPGGLVVDYIGIASDLKRAMKTYTESKGRGEPTHDIHQAFALLLKKLDIIRGMFAKNPAGEGFDYSDFATHPQKLLIGAANYIFGLPDGKKRFLDETLALSKAYSLCSTLDEAQEFHTEIAFFVAVKIAMTKVSSVDSKRTQEEKDSILKQILDNAILAEGVQDIFALCGLEKPNIGLLSDEFLEEVRALPERNFAVELLEKLLKDTIRAKTRKNVIQEKKYSERLLETLRKYNSRGIETAQVIEELIAMAKQFQKDMEREANLGLNPDEIAFYDALANNESAILELGDEVLKKIAVELTERLRASATVDWQKRESVRARLRILVRQILRRYKYPPDRAKEAMELVMQQAEALADFWTQE